MNVRILLVALVLVSGAAVLWGVVGEAPPAQAGVASAFQRESLSDLGDYVLSDKPQNLRLVALAQVGAKDGAEGELDEVARQADLGTAVFAVTAQGKRRTSAAKAKLLALLGDSKLHVELRKAAMTAVAEHFQNAGDLSDLWSRAKDDSALSAHYRWVKTYVYER